MSEAISTTPSIIINSLASQLASRAIGLSEAPTYDWLNEQLKPLIESGNIDEAASRIIRQLVNTEVSLTAAAPPPVVQMNEDRGHLVTEERLSEQQYQWSLFFRRVEEKTSKRVAKSLKDASDRVMLALPDPQQNDREFCSKGLVIGDVQAGKTNNYTAVINRAADLGYKLVIVLTGMTEGLRRQTQVRLDNDFVGIKSVAQRGAQIHDRCGIGRYSDYDIDRKPSTLTDHRNDFSRANSNGVFVAPMNTACLIVTKKNKSILEAILGWINTQTKNEKSKFEHPVLLIDDEADNASVNTGDPDQDPKAINHLIRQILTRCSRISYVAYTATPFANIFIDPDSGSDNSGLIDLYPSHFIIALNSPSNYCGGEFFYKPGKFKETPYVVQEIVDCESFIPLKHKADLRPESIPLSMKHAIASFYVGAAIKDLRRASGALNKDSNPFDSCLINVSRFTAVQNDLAHPVKEWMENIAAEIELASPIGSSLPLKMMRDIFEKDYATSIYEDYEWNDVFESMLKMEAPVLRVVHSASADKLDYDDAHCPKKVIAIGGFKLSRGLTLEGLTVSYFYRRSLMYDTLMQMARWFGYKDQYRDLIRLYTTRESCDWYAHITDSTLELKEYLVEMERDGLEPKDFGIKVRSHEDSLLVTAKNKMKTGKEIRTSVSYKNQALETVYVDRRSEVNDYNLRETREFLSPFELSFEEQARNGNRDLVTIGVPSGQVISYLRRLRLHRGNRWAADESLIKYLEKHCDTLWKSWDVAVRSVHSSNKAEIFSDKYAVGVQRRSPKKLLKPATSYLNDSGDFAIALSDNRRVASADFDYVGIPKEALTENLKASGKAAREWKRDNHPSPLLLVQLVNLDLERSVSELESQLGDDSIANKHAELSHYKQALELEIEGVGADLASFYLAISISLPDHNEADDATSYVLTTRALRELFAGLEEETDDD